jgi:DNA-binding MarR family transcriptional regulator
MVQKRRGLTEPNNADYDHRVMKRRVSAKNLLKLAQAHVRRVVPKADLSSLAVSFTLIRAADRLVYDLETVHRDVGWTWPGFRVLFWLWLLGPLEQREIASLINGSRANISSVLNTLQRDGFVTRKRHAADRRQVRVAVSAAGQRLIETAFKAHNQRERQWVSIFSKEERKLLVDLLTRLIDHQPPPRSSRP